MTVEHTLSEPISPALVAAPRELASVDMHNNRSNNAAVPADRVGLQVKHSSLTISRSGYHFQSIDCSERSITIGFDSHIVRGSNDELTGDRSIIIHGIVGIFKLEQFSYILVITDSCRRGSICDQDIYEVSAVYALPLDYSGGKAMFKKIIRAQQIANKHSSQSDASANTSESLELPTNVSVKGSASNAKWIPYQITRIFSAGQASTVGNMDLEAHTSSDDATNSIDDATPIVTDSALERMEGRILEEIVRVFSASGMFYSYTYDLTHSLQTRNRKSDELLACVADSCYWFNKHIQESLLESFKEWSLPLVQGCVQISQCQLSECSSLQVAIVSRRNCRRVGMRYERRGADGDGNTANFVETEQILTTKADKMPVHHASFVQTRGSMPFCWKQPNSGLQPMPVVVGDTNKNSAVCARHLIREIDRVGRQILVNLVEHKGRESVVGSAYASIVGNCVSSELIDARMIRYIPWDFHHETRGMHYEKLHQFVEQLQREISDMGYFWYSDDNVLTLQQGVFRINCMDCLDRTNVVQSTIARAVLSEQLVRMGVHAAPEQGLSVYPKLESILSHLWANNGDYISRQYAGTSAMKGDFTRTGRRNFSGVVNDATYSLARLWINTFRDYFSQSVLDFIVGNHQAATVFRTLIDLRSHEPEHIQQIVLANEAKIRDSVHAAVGSGESVKLACMVQSPMELGTLKLENAVDSVLIVTDAAVYVCGSSSQHRQSSVSIELSALTGVQYGAYITETRTPQGLDPSYNHGIVLKFDSASKQQAGAIVTASKKDASCTSSQFIACKVTSEAQVVMQHANESTNGLLSASIKDIALVRMERLEKQTPNLLTEHICSTILSQKLVTSATDQFIADSPIISAAAAKQGVSFVDKMASQLHYAFWI
ncbi:SacI homology domain-containing protein [Coemansia mojavensis]|nr:SacI homology domain-containing protein [Coemansia mojavensis]